MNRFININAADSKSGMRNTIIGQSFGLVANQALYSGGIAILFVLSLTDDSLLAFIAYNALYFGAAASFVTALFARPASPKKFMLQHWFLAGIILISAGFAPYVGNLKWAAYLFVVGLYLFHIFTGAGGTYWFPVLQDFIPEEQRGRFFAKLRATWTAVSLIVILLLSQFIDDHSSYIQYARIIVILGLLFIFRNYFIQKLPELPASIREPNGKPSLQEIWSDMKNNKKFHRFLWYIGVTSFFIGCINPVLILYMKTLLQLQDSQNITIAAVGSFGAFIAFLFCGIFVDRVGSRRIFFITQLFMGFSILGLAFISTSCAFILPFIFIINIIVRGLQAAHGVAATSYLFFLMNGTSRALFSAIHVLITSIMMGLSTGISGFVTKYYAGFHFENGSTINSIFQIIFLISGSIALASLPLVRFIEKGRYQLRVRHANRL